MDEATTTTAPGPATDPAAETLALLREIRDRLADNAGEVLDPEGAARFVHVALGTWHRLHLAGMTPKAAYISDRCLVWSRRELHAWILAGAPSRRKWETQRDSAMKRA